MKKIRLTICLLAVVNLSHAQAAEDSIKAAVNQFFTALKNADTTMLRQTLAPNALLQTVAGNATTAQVRDESINDFLKSIAGLKAGEADERIEFETIKVSGPLAVAWTPYHFYFREKFSHCGVNSFQLVRLGGVWKIQYIIDTRTKERCKP